MNYTMKIILYLFQVLLIYGLLFVLAIFLIFIVYPSFLGTFYIALFPTIVQISYLYYMYKRNFERKYLISIFVVLGVTTFLITGLLLEQHSI